MKVWVVTSHDGWGEGHDVDGVYVSLPAAQKAVRRANKGVVFHGDTKASRVADDDPGEHIAPFIAIKEYDLQG